MANNQNDAIRIPRIPDGRVDAVIALLEGAGVDTGVDGSMLKLCTTISREIYNFRAINFGGDMEARLRQITPFNDLEVIQIWPNAVMDIGIGVVDANVNWRVPFCLIKANEYLILAWCGSETTWDWLARNLAARHSSLDLDDVPELEVHKRYHGVVQENIGNAANSFRNIIQQYVGENGGCTKILLTGHSLGGGIAQVAHLCLKADMFEMDLSNVTSINTVVFAAPMSIALTTTIDDLEEAKKQRLSQLSEGMANIVYGQDPVPRSFSNVAFVNALREAIVSQAGGVFGAIGTLFDAIVGIAEEHIIQYRHLGRIVHFKTHNEAPASYNHEQFEGIRYDTNRFVDIAHVKQEHNHIGHRESLAFN